MGWGRKITDQLNLNYKNSEITIKRELHYTDLERGEECIFLKKRSRDNNGKHEIKSSYKVPYIYIFNSKLSLPSIFMACVTN